eukprot:2239315-Rhodomonas_salina.2
MGDSQPQPAAQRRLTWDKGTSQKPPAMESQTKAQNGKPPAKANNARPATARAFGSKGSSPMWERVGLPAKDVQATIQRLRESAGAFSPFHVSGSKQSPSASSQSRPPSWGSRSSVGNGHGEDFSRLPSPGARICKDLGKTAVGPVHWL